MELEKLEDVLPSPNLSIDILSLINTNNESDADESFDGFEQIGFKESVNREGKGDEERELNRFIRCSSQGHYEYRFPSAKTQDDFCLNFNNDVFIVPDNIYSKNNAASFEKENSGNYLPCNHYNSSFYVYLNNLSSEKDLHKYFRPCHACQKTYCICLDSLPSYKVPVSSFDSCKRLLQKEGKNKNLLGRQTVSNMNFIKMNKSVETDVNITKFDGCEYEFLSFQSSKLLNDKGSFECLDLESYKERSRRNSKTSFSPLLQKKRNFCCQTFICDHSTHGHLGSGFDMKASFESLREPCLDDDPNQLLTWAPFLENVARNARNLVRDLELIMKTYKSESN